MDSICFGVRLLTFSFCSTCLANCFFSGQSTKQDSLRIAWRLVLVFYKHEYVAGIAINQDNKDLICRWRLKKLRQDILCTYCCSAQPLLNKYSMQRLIALLNYIGQYRLIKGNDCAYPLHFQASRQISCSIRDLSCDINGKPILCFC